MTEQKMGLIDGGLHANIFCDRQEDGSIEVDVSIILHVLASPCLAAVRSYFGAEPLIQMANFLVRRLDAHDKRIMDLHVPYHQDGFGYNESNVDLVNCWTLLSPDECGLTSPGLEFILDRVGHVLELEEHPRPSSYSHSEPSYRRIADYRDAYDPWQPSIQLGDVVLFNKLSIHRTWLHQGQTMPRYSAELRLMPNNAINRAFNATRKQPIYTVSGETLAGPSRIRYHSNGTIEVLACSEWSLK